MLKNGRFRRIAVVVSLIAAAGALAWAWDHRGYWSLNNFRVVEPGKIYAGGFQYPIPLQRLIQQYGIRTVLTLREGNDSFEKREQEVLESSGVVLKKIVVPYQVPDADRIAVIEQAVDFIQDEANQPVYVHCWAGCHRTGAVVAIYRVREGQWSEAQAREELMRYGGMALGTQWPSRILQVYCAGAGDGLASQLPAGPIR